MTSELKTRLRALFRRKRIEDELDAEVRYHLERQIEVNVANGMSPDEARQAALRQFGNPELTKENCRDERGVNLIDAFLTDTRYALRTMRKAPLFAMVATLTLALGIGANTAVFSLAYSVLFKPLPYADPDRLVVLHSTKSDKPLDPFDISEADYRDWEKQAQSFDKIALITYWTANVTGIPTPERIVSMSATGEFFNLLGTKPLLGRVFTPADDRADSPNVVVLSHSLWKRLFDGRSDVIGKPVVINGNAHEIIGVMPPEFAFPVEHAYMWLPMRTEMQGIPRNARFLMGAARLKPGVSIEQAQAEMDVIAAALAQQYPDSNTGWGVRVLTAHETIVGTSRSTLFLLLGAVAAVLLIACANLANLLLARLVARRKEMAIRIAIGASRGRLIRQTLTENLVLCGIGGALAVGVAYYAVELVKSAYPAEMPRLQYAELSMPAIAFAFGLSIFTALVLGVLAAWQAVRVNTNSALKLGGETSAVAHRRDLLGRGIVVAQFALSVVLLIGGGLLVRSLVAVLNTSPGFRTENVLTFSVWLTGKQFSDPKTHAPYVEDALRRIEAMPDTISAATVTHVPLSNGGRTAQKFQVSGSEVLDAEAPIADYRAVSPGYFSTAGVPLLSGRDFNDSDKADGVPVIIINQRMAGRYWPNEDPIGKQIRWTDDHFDEHNPPLTIVGVAGDTRVASMEKEDTFAVYVPYRQKALPYLRWVGFVVHTRSDALAMWPAIREELLRLSPDRAFYEVRTTQKLVENSIAERRFNTLLIGAFCFIALLLAVLGIYGLISYATSQRVKEFGIRIALGARSADVLGMVLRQGVTLALIGLMLGVIGAYYLSRLMSKMLYGIEPHDGLTFAAVPLLLLSAALAACYLPALRATKTDPLIAIRTE